jgi:hypothetical protein
MAKDKEQKREEKRSAAKEQLDSTMEQMPYLGVPINPPPVLSPRVIIPGGKAGGRYLIATDGDVLLIIDTQYGRTCGHSAEAYRESIEELIRLANRPG